MHSQHVIAVKFGSGLLALAVIVAAAAPLQAAPNAEQKAKLVAAQGALKKAEGLFKTKSYAEAGAAVKEADQAIMDATTTGSPKDVMAVITPLRKRVDKAKELLEAQGIKVPAAVAAAPPAATPPAGAAPKPADPAAPAPAGVPTGMASFSRHVAPILIARCGNCHVTMSKGETSMATFAALKKGNKDGAIILEGKEDSRIIEVIKEGSMPKGGGKVTADELATLIKWLKEGARFDGPSQEAPIDDYAVTTAQMNRPKLEVSMGSGKEAVQFGRDIGPILLEQCADCHTGQQPRGRLNMGNFRGLLQGGMSGVAITPGKPAESLLVQKIKGSAKKDRMPLKKPPLADDVIAKIEKWIADGAKYDWTDPAAPLETVVAIIKAQNSTHEQLAETRVGLTAKDWRLTIPDTDPKIVSTKNFLVYGNVGEETLNDVGKTAEEQVAKIEKMFKIPADQPFVKGKMSLFVFDKRYDYGEIGEMVEKREIPSEWKGHWRHTIVEAYGCVLPAKNGEYPLDSLIGQQVGGMYVAEQGKIPRWFAEGSARAIASRIDPKDSRVRAWDNRMSEIHGAMSKPDAFLTGNLPPEESDIIAYGFVKNLMANLPRYQALLQATKSGVPFDQAFTKNFGATPNQLAGSWSGSTGSTSKTKRAR